MSGFSIELHLLFQKVSNNYGAEFGHLFAVYLSIFIYRIYIHTIYTNALKRIRTAIARIRNYIWLETNISAKARNF